VNTPQAKKALALYRPKADEALQPETKEALERVRRDPELRQWFEAHCAFQDAMRKSFQEIEPPAGLKERILEGRKIVRPSVWQRRAGWLALAAAFAVLLGLAAMWFKPAPPNDFSIYQHRMVGSVLREYRMDVVTNDPAEVRSFLAAHHAPSDYVLPEELDNLQIAGAGLLRWQDRPVSMVCFDRGDSAMLFLFIVDRDSIQSPPPPSPVVEPVNQLLTASWTQDGRTYLLAGPPDTALLRSFQ
jgi:hypothetical protein